MDRVLVIKYLRFLCERAEALLQKEPIEGYDIAVLQRELGDFRRNFQAGTLNMPALEESILALELKASDRDVGSDKGSPFRRAMQAAFGRGAIMQELEHKRQRETKERIRTFRDEVSHLLFAIET